MPNVFGLIAEDICDGVVHVAFGPRAREYDDAKLHITYRPRVTRSRLRDYARWTTQLENYRFFSVDLRLLRTLAAICFFRVTLGGSNALRRRASEMMPSC